MIKAATRWQDNSEMIQDVAKLGYIQEDDWVLDATYGKGTWWKHWRPTNLVTTDLYTDADIQASYYRLPFADNTFDVVTYDPPYVSKGGRKTSTMKDHQDRYGLVKAPKNPEQLQANINTGLYEVARVARCFVLVKCQDYVSSGKIWWGTDETRFAAENKCDLRAVDKLYFLNNGSAQPPRTRKDGKPSVQQHARVNVSVLWIFRKV